MDALPKYGRIDLTGKQIGRWLVLRRDTTNTVSRTGNKTCRYICLCQLCNKEYSVNSGSLRAGGSSSCYPCTRVKTPEERIEAGFRAVYSSYKASAKKRGLPFEFTKAQARKLFLKPCYYCGSPPSHNQVSGARLTGFIHGGIDRVDNNLGYTKANSVPCCTRDNRAKLDHTEDDYLAHIKRVYEHRKLQNWTPPPVVEMTPELPPQESSGAAPAL